MSVCDDCGAPPGHGHYDWCVYLLNEEPPPLPPPPAVATPGHMITPKEAREKRSVRSCDAYKIHVAEITALLCTAPRADGTWWYICPHYRDAGLIVSTLVSDFQAAGWSVTKKEGSLVFSDPTAGGMEMPK